MSASCTRILSQHKGTARSRRPWPHARPWAVRLFGTLWLILLTACSGPRTPPPTPPQREIAISSAAAITFGERIQDALHASDTPVSIEIREEEITSYLALKAQDAGYKASALRIWITRDGIWIRTPIFLGLDRAPRAVRSSDDDVTALFQPTASEGALHITIVTATWRGRTLPRWLLASAEAVANDALADANLALDVEQIILGEGSLHILLNSR